jgi:hypothetical protein
MWLLAAPIVGMLRRSWTLTDQDGTTHPIRLRVTNPPQVANPLADQQHHSETLTEPGLAA